MRNYSRGMCGSSIACVSELKPQLLRLVLDQSWDDPSALFGAMTRVSRPRLEGVDQVACESSRALVKNAMQRQWWKSRWWKVTTPTELSSMDTASFPAKSRGSARKLDFGTTILSPPELPSSRVLHLLKLVPLTGRKTHLVHQLTAFLPA